jgi:hypothetical protein
MFAHVSARSVFACQRINPTWRSTFWFQVRIAFQHLHTFVSSNARNLKWMKRFFAQPRRGFMAKVMPSQIRSANYDVCHSGFSNRFKMHGPNHSTRQFSGKATF